MRKDGSYPMLLQGVGRLNKYRAARERIEGTWPHVVSSSHLLSVHDALHITASKPTTQTQNNPLFICTNRYFTVQGSELCVAAGCLGLLAIASPSHSCLPRAAYAFESSIVHDVG